MKHFVGIISLIAGYLIVWFIQTVHPIEKSNFFFGSLIVAFSLACGITYILVDKHERGKA